MMTLQEFILRLETDKEDFVKIWTEENRNHPEIFPMELDLDEWYRIFSTGC